MDLITKETAEKTTWMILEGLGYSKKNNTDLVKTVHEIFDTAPIEKGVEVTFCENCIFFAGSADSELGMCIGDGKTKHEKSFCR